MVARNKPVVTMPRLNTMPMKIYMYDSSTRISTSFAYQDTYVNERRRVRIHCPNNSHDTP